MTERYTFTTTLTGLRLALHMMLSLGAAGYTTVCTLAPERWGRLNNQLLHLEATPAPRPNREARGCYLIKGE